MSNILSKALNIKKQQIALLLSFLCVFFLTLVLNFLYPIFADDWEYSFIFGSENTRISSLFDIIISQYNHYMMWGGRSIVHFIAQVLLSINFFIACCINALAYTTFIYILYKIANKGYKINLSLFFLFNLLIWFSQPAFYSTITWKTGSANYLWGALIVILFIYPYHTYYLSRKSSNSIIKTSLFFIGGVIAGWTNENMGVALAFYIIVSFLIFRHEKLNIPRWAIAGLIGVIIGCAIMLSAPGNYIRMGIINEIYSKQGLSRYDIFWNTLKEAVRLFLRYILPLLGTYLILLILYQKYYREKSNKLIVIKSSLLFVITGLVALAALTVSPSLPTRALFGIIILFLIPIGTLCANISFKYKYLRILGIFVYSTLFIIYGIQYSRAYKTLYLTSSFWKERESYVNAQKEKGIDTITFSKRFQISSRYFIHDLSDNPNFWENELYSKYYGIKSVKVIDNSIEKEE